MLHFEKHTSPILNSFKSWSCDARTASWLCLTGQVIRTKRWANWILFIGVGWGVRGREGKRQRLRRT